jgi:cation:H+ antiporter
MDPKVAVEALILSLVVILVACSLFTNAVEWLGRRLKVNQAVVGSVFAAVGTAMPETVVPVMAILVYGDTQAVDVGLGAVAGAPFMLATLAFFVTGAAVLVFSGLERREREMNAEPRLVVRDLTWFLALYGAAVAVSLVHDLAWLRYAVAVGLVGAYVFYVHRTFADRTPTEEATEPLEELTFSRYLRRKRDEDAPIVPPHLVLIIVQLAVALAAIIFGAHRFVGAAEAVAATYGVAPLLLSIIITPVATELPEKFNSVIWVLRGKDTLALGNITGAMVFQTCVPVAFAIAFTSWRLTGVTLVSALLALGTALASLIWIKATGRVNPYALLAAGVGYAGFFGYVVFGRGG